MSRKWTKDDLDELELMVNNVIPWKQIASQLERSIYACKMKWMEYKVVKKSTTKLNFGKWDDFEIKKLKWAYNELGDEKWELIASHVCSRTMQQCQEKMKRMKRSKYMNDEEKELLEAFGARYCATKFPHRSLAAWKCAKFRLKKL